MKTTITSVHKLQRILIKILCEKVNEARKRGEKNEKLLKRRNENFTTDPRNWLERVKFDKVITRDI